MALKTATGAGLLGDGFCQTLDYRTTISRYVIPVEVDELHELGIEGIAHVGTYHLGKGGAGCLLTGSHVKGNL